jgi:hypothetical protein
MNADLQQWLSELRHDGIVFAGDHGGADANLWSISLPSTSAIPADDLATFVLAAAAVRAELVALQGIAPVTFYAWHDEMAGQLRFSTARCTSDSLPFSAAIQLVDHPAEIVRCFLSSPYRDGLPWATLRAGAGGDQASEGRAHEEHDDDVLRVWARRLA